LNSTIKKDPDKMKKKILWILNIMMWAALIAGVFVLVGYTNSEQSYMPARQLVIRIDYGNSDTLISHQDVLDILNRSGFTIRGQETGYINFEKIEKEIRMQPYVSKAEVYNSLEGVTEIDVVQRRPILRIFNSRNESFYLDASGILLPVHPGFPVRVPVANGFIPEPFQKNVSYTVDSVKKKDSTEYLSTLVNLYRLADYISKDKFLKAQIQQIYVDKTGEFELIPLVGNHIIVFGNAEDIPDKFERLVVFYKQGLNKTGWTRYRKIIIKYKNQIVCS
jgi:cell division protein FtsQ